MKASPRILHVMWTMSIGGAERAVYQLVREQRLRGIDADVVVAHSPGLYGERVAGTGAIVHELRCRNALDVVSSRRLTSLARRYDVVHFHSIEPLLIAAASRTRACTLVYTHRGGIRRHGVVKKARLAAARPLLRRRFSAISGNTRQSARVVAGYLGIDPESVAVVYNGLDFDLLSPEREHGEVLAELPPAAADQLLVGTASNLQPLKRVDFLLDAIALRRDLPVHCVVLGDGPVRHDLEALAQELQIADRVTFLGRKKHVGDYLQLFDIFVLPSGPQEAFGNAAVEAMGVGIPTIVFADGGGLIEHVVDGETGRVVESAEGLACVLSELAADGSLRQELGDRGRQYVRSAYSLDAMFERYAQLYETARGSSK